MKSKPNTHTKIAWGVTDTISSTRRKSFLKEGGERTLSRTTTASVKTIILLTVQWEFSISQSKHKKMPFSTDVAAVEMMKEL